jgi:hypothetical protein
MPLNLAALKTSPGLPGAGGRNYPPTAAGCATEWAAAVEAWASSIVPPSTTIAAARATLEGAILAAFQSPAVAPALDAAFAAFAVTVAAGMLPLNTGVPPPGPVGFAALLATVPAPSTRQAGVDLIANAIHAWGGTGSATLVAPPYTVVPWT